METALANSAHDQVMDWCRRAERVRRRPTYYYGIPGMRTGTDGRCHVMDLAPFAPVPLFSGETWEAVLVQLPELPALL